MPTNKADADGTGQGLVEFWDWAADKGHMNKNTAGALRAACSQVLAVEGEDLRKIDIRSLDVEDILKRFENLRKKDFTPQSLSTYLGRFRKAVSMYLAFLDNPSGWITGGRTRASTVTKGANGEAPGPKAGSEFVTYPFPLRKGMIVQLQLPSDLKGYEVKRLTAYLETITVDEQPPSPADEATT